MRYLYHALVLDQDVGDPYSPATLASEGFVHCSFAPAVHETIELYLPKDEDIVVFQIDPRRLSCPLVIDETPRGPMPHVHGGIPRKAVTAKFCRETLPDELPDQIEV